jgi:hypothetical protein
MPTSEQGKGDAESFLFSSIRKASFTISMQQMVRLLTWGTVEGGQVSKHGGDKRNVTTTLPAIPKSQLQKFFRQWKDLSEGDYFGGN